MFNKIAGLKNLPKVSQNSETSAMESFFSKTNKSFQLHIMLFVHLRNFLTFL